MQFEVAGPAFLESIETAINGLERSAITLGRHLHQSLKLFEVNLQTWLDCFEDFVRYFTSKVFLAVIHR